jgi:hypothetical protein
LQMASNTPAATVLSSELIFIVSPCICSVEIRTEDCLCTARVTGVVYLTVAGELVSNQDHGASPLSYGHAKKIEARAEERFLPMIEKLQGLPEELGRAKCILADKWVPR